MKNILAKLQRFGGDEANSEVEKKYPLDEMFTFAKLLEYLPPLIVTNISTLLLVTVDGIVAGNFVGDDALSAISIFAPIETLIGAITVVLSTGASAVLSNRIGEVDADRIMQAKKTVKYLSVLFALFLSIIQIPIVFFLIASYHLTDDMYELTRAYATGIMISTPFGLISTIAVYQMQIMGKMKALMKLALMEGILNLILDIFFTGVLHLGVAGTGYGTALACAIRCIVTMAYLYIGTDIFKTGNARISLEDAWEIITKGLPDASSMLVTVLQNYIMVRILLSSFGPDGGVIKGVCSFCYTLTNVLMSSVQGAVRPIIGLFNGAENRKGVRGLMRWA
ncbi:MATE family efflux transporter [Butyrivibrio sp. LC3010]|uniref:MATE family efflux transporter n=1 Tax=Butyrivibrio sp. LC3010 TaxID=1280680 RepID=UPI000417BF6E|nr:MATE family efflux transporter [Butyrivibrio sp. LC3010]